MSSFGQEIRNQGVELLRIFHIGHVPALFNDMQSCVWQYLGSPPSVFDWQDLIRAPQMGSVGILISPKRSSIGWKFSFLDPQMVHM
jgi:hypothetical protein